MQRYNVGTSEYLLYRLHPAVINKEQKGSTNHQSQLYSLSEIYQNFLNTEVKVRLLIRLRSNPLLYVFNDDVFNHSFT